MRTGEDAIVVERAESALVVRSAETDAAAVGYAAALPAEAERTTVVVDASAAGALQALDDRLVARLRDLLYAEPPRRWEMRLVAARTGRPGSSGEPPLAARLADRLGMGVVAPDGELIALRGGELFSAGPGAGWLGFGRAVHPEWTGPRYPAPAWQSALPRELRSPKPRPLSRLRGRASSVTVTAIPAGVWVRKAGSPPMPLVDLGFGVPVEAARPIVLVGAPGEQPPAVAELAAFLECLPPAVRDIAVLVPYGQHPEACAALAQSLANRLNGLVRAYHALPHYATDGTRKFAVFNERATPDRLTETPEDAYLPSRATPRAREDDEDLYGDPVVFDTLLESPTPPAPAPDPALTTGPRSTQPGSLGGTASVTVDAQGRLRPATPTGRRPAEPRPARTHTGGGEKGHPTTPATHAPPLDTANREVANNGTATHEAADHGLAGHEAGHGVAGQDPAGREVAGRRVPGPWPRPAEATAGDGEDNRAATPAAHIPALDTADRDTAGRRASGPWPHPAETTAEGGGEGYSTMPPAHVPALDAVDHGAAIHEAVGSGSAGHEAVGHGVVGHDTAGRDTAGYEAAGREAAGRRVPGPWPRLAETTAGVGEDNRPATAAAHVPALDAVGREAADRDTAGRRVPGSWPHPAETTAEGGGEGYPATPPAQVPALYPTGREATGREATGREAVGNGAADQDTTGHDTAGREAVGNGAADQYTADQYTADQYTAGQEAAGQEMAGQEVGVGPSVFRTTASTVLPQTRPSARVVAPPEQAASPAEAVLPEPGPRPVAPDDGSNAEDPANRPVRAGERAVTDAPPPTSVHDTAFAADPGSRADMPEATGAAARGHGPWTIRADVRPVSDERTSAPLAGEGASPTGPLSSAVPPQAPAPVPADDAPTAPRIPQRRDYDRLWLAKRVSTPQERQAFRASLGWRYDAAARSVARLLAEHPGLRSAGPPDEALMTDLAAVRVFAGRDQAATVESFRLGEDDADRAFAACVAGGLRRLPSFQGVVVRGGPSDPGAADLYREGEDLVEAAPLIALDDLGAEVPGGLEILIWSATARRLTGFAENRRVREVAFLPGTVFRVLAVAPPSAAAVRRVLLTEVPPAKAGRAHTEWTDRVRARLVEAAESRPATPSTENGESDDRFAALPGDPAFDELRSRP
ncbi:hypothetical protein [Actinoallomurus iriomotensis]|uniref:Uncharacterized protein n=1 Tax=Actinoallomurus iriomotensis TaxID=478107 RepID=A0A9W6RWY5_9ACTN|nr:hypothetical protein [Actinoallomurus iriomotensis]GLY83535.1 hypothetical protein Airi02_014650 [Actinoallomurus iriomotensis]